MDWSFQLLDADEQAVLRHLAAFRGGCDLESASAVCGTDLSGGTLDVLISLVDKSFVTAVDRDDSTRYRLHEAIREYAEGSMSAGDLDVVRDRHARWFVALAARLAQGPAAGGEQRWIRRHDVDRDNFQAAAEWLLGREPRTALRLLIDIEPGTDLTTQWRWCDDGIRQVLPLAVDSPAADRAAALALLTWVDAEFGRPSAVAQCAEAAALLDEIDDPAVRCSVLMMVARCHADAANGDLDAAEVAAAIAAGDRAGGTYWPIMVRHFLSFRASAPIAESLTTDALRIAERLGLEFFGALMRTTLAVLAQFRGDGAAALALWRRTVTVLDDRVIYAEDNAGFYALAEGEHGELLLGLHLAEDFAVRLTSGPHEPAVVAALHVVIAHLRGLAGDVDGAEDALEIVDRTAELSFDFIGGLAVVTRSKLLRMRGHTGAAAATIRPMSDHVGFTGITDIPMRVLEELAAVALALGRRDDAADLLATARQARQDSHKPLSPACRPDLAVLESTVADLTGITLSNVDVRAVAAAMEPPSS
jgi:hypothetical protein